MRRRVEAGRERAAAAREAMGDRIDAAKEATSERVEAAREATVQRIEATKEATGERVDNLMGNKPEERFRFIQENAAFAAPDALDV